LTLITSGTRHTIDYGKLARQFEDLMDHNVTDPTVREWLTPTFSTTTNNDRVVRSVVMMATLRKYFEFRVWSKCGLPEVTLEGNKDDWADMYERLDKLKEYGPQTIAWYHLLKPVLRAFVRAFDDPHGEANIDFWSHVAHYESGGSGPRFLCGWITAFCMWDAEGEWQGLPFKEDLLPDEVTSTPADVLSLSAAEFAQKYQDTRPPRLLVLEGPTEVTLHKIDGAVYHAATSVPSGFAEVDVLVEENGETVECSMLAGSVGMTVGEERDCVQPVSGWWIYSKSKKTEDTGR
jgi:hypothetical protein